MAALHCLMRHPTLQQTLIPAFLAWSRPTMAAGTAEFDRAFVEFSAHLATLHSVVARRFPPHRSALHRGPTGRGAVRKHSGLPANGAVTEVSQALLRRAYRQEYRLPWSTYA